MGKALSFSNPKHFPMERTDPVFLKLQRIERLMKLKESTERKKEEVLDYLTEQMKALAEEAEVAEFELSLYNRLGELRTEFDQTIERIDETLLQVAA